MVECLDGNPKKRPTFEEIDLRVRRLDSEIVEPGEALDYGKIFESNSKMLNSALLHLGFEDISIHKIEDNYKKGSQHYP